MPDNRTRMEKLRAMASQTEQSPEEAKVARQLIQQIMAASPINGDGRVLSAEEILGTPDRESVGGSMRIRTKGGGWATIDVDEMTVVFEPET